MVEEGKEGISREREVRRESKEHVKLEIQIWKQTDEKKKNSKELVQNIPVDFFVESKGKELATEILRRALKFIKQEDERFEFHQGRKQFSIPMKDILYFCSDMRIIHVITRLGEFQYYGTLKELSERLTKDFVVIHKSFVVNSAYVMQYSFDSVCLTDGTTLSISRTYRSKVRGMLAAFRR